MMGMPSESRSWDRSNEEVPQMAAGIHTNPHLPCMTAMQQSNYYNLHGFYDSTGSLIPKVSSPGEPSSTSAVEKGVANNHFETNPPPFIDFLGVGAT